MESPSPKHTADAADGAAARASTPIHWQRKGEKGVWEDYPAKENQILTTAYNKQQLQVCAGSICSQNPPVDRHLYQIFPTDQPPAHLQHLCIYHA